MEKKFYADSKCTGCGVCEQICLSKKIEIVDNKPTWKKDLPCFFCFACISYCPEQAIQIGKRTLNRGRYHNPKISVRDIMEQKNE